MNKKNNIQKYTSYNVGKKRKIGSNSQKMRRIFAKRNQRAKPLPVISQLIENEGPERSDKDYTNLRQCHDRAAVEQLRAGWNSKFFKKCRLAVAKRKMEDSTKTKLSAILKGQPVTSVPILTNEKVFSQAFDILATDLPALVANDNEIEVVMITVISGDGGTSHEKPSIELHHSQRRTQSLLRAISPDYFGVTEFALFNSHPHPDGGQHLQRHEHALVWGKNVVAKAERITGKHLRKFPSNITDAPTVTVRRVATDQINLIRVCSYLLKLPHRCMTWCPSRDGKAGFMHQSEKGDRYIRYLRMAQILSMVTFEDMTYAGGEGRSIRSAIVKLLRASCEADAPADRRLFHPDAMASFWQEVAKQLGKTNWTLPVIARQK